VLVEVSVSSAARRTAFKDSIFKETYRYFEVIKVLIGLFFYTPMEKTQSIQYEGLSVQKAQTLLNTYGYNEIPSQKNQGILEILWEVIKEPMLLLLLGSGLIYLMIGEPKDAMMLLVFAGAVISMTFYQIRKTERALEALKNLSSPRALVIRGGEQIRIAGREVVKGDLIVLEEGDRVPADARVISCSHLQTDESLLTGESLAVRKTEWNGVEEIKPPGGEDLPFVYSGTLVIQGHGIAEVTNIGIHTQMGHIGKELQTIVDEDTLLKKETGNIVKNVAIAGLILCIIVVVLYGLMRGDWIKGFLSGLTLSMSLLPQEFIVVLLIFLSLGAWRMSKYKVLTRKTAAIETLGAATVLCVDKTGTLTLNKMQLQELYNGDSSYQIPKEGKPPLPEEFHHLLEYSILASQKNPNDPIEKEIKQNGTTFLLGTEHMHHTWKLLKEYPLSKSLLALSHVWESPDKNEYIIASKGAPEAIIDLCHLDGPQTKKIMAEVHRLSKHGLRVLGVAQTTMKKGDLPGEQHDFPFSFVGLIGFADPVRATVPDALKKAYTAGIRVIMITGDYPGTASYIAKEIGLRNYDVVITGPELAKMSHSELREKIKTATVFARVVPEQKLLLVNALKANGKIVAMTGDGVNDAPALKAAHIGISMGERGTDVAREASDLVLLNDDFASIIHAIQMGRRIYENLKKAMAYILAVHVPIAGMSFFPILLNMPLILLPAHIAFLEIVIDPACSVVFESEPEEADSMKQPPRSLHTPILSQRIVVLSLIQGVFSFLMAFIVLLVSMRMGMGINESRALVFATLVFSNIMLILTNLSWKYSIIHILKKRNESLPWVIAAAVLLLTLVLTIPFLRNIFYFSPLHIEDVLVTFLLSVVSILWFEGYKFVVSRRSSL